MTKSDVGWPTWMGVVVDDMEAQRQFYRDGLGFRETGSGEGWRHFDVEGNLFELLQREPVPQYDRIRYQVGFTVQDIHVARRQLIQRGAEPITGIEGESDSRNAWAYFRDPEGNVFEITQWLDR
jgi:catechol 2,3-dioxygenase-like lactoylglutathione lyase family enzyme